MFAKNPNLQYLRVQTQRFELMLQLLMLERNGSSQDSGNTEVQVDDFRERVRAQITEIDTTGRIAPEQHSDTRFQLVNLGHKMSLSPVDLDAYLIRLALDEVPGFRSHCDSATGNDYPRKSARYFLEDLLCTIHGDTAYDAFEKNAPLFTSGLLRYAPGELVVSPKDEVIKVNPICASILLGKQNSIAGVKIHSAEIEVPAPHKELETVPNLVTILSNAQKSFERFVVQFNGPEGAGKERLARYICSRAKLPCLEVDLNHILQSATPIELIQDLVRAACAMGHVLLLKSVDILARKGHEGAAFKLNQELRAEHIMAILTAREKSEPGGMDTFTAVLTLPGPDQPTREKIWADVLAGYNIADDVSMEDMARTFHIAGASLHRAVRNAAGEATLRNGSNQIERMDLVRACRQETTGRMKELAGLVQPKFTWDDLIMTNQTKSLLKEVQNAVSDRRIVYDEWTMHGQGTAERGMSILFSGPPGTGKTMAASIIARELGLELYKLDLSRVVSKYVGETEKNLATVFDEAEKANAVLFFDEADSLFGKRGDIKGAQDHYVNQQVGFLLQKVESFQGVAFLATNLSDNMDPAFERRFNHIVRFRMPKPPERTEIWKRSFSSSTPLADSIDFEALGKDFTASGAQIKNIARNAAFLAAADKAREVIEVTQDHILHATLREFDKDTIAWEMEYSGQFREELSRIRTVLKGP